MTLNILPPGITIGWAEVNPDLEKDELSKVIPVQDMLHELCPND